MKKLKTVVRSLLFGMILSSSALAVAAACDEKIAINVDHPFGGYICSLVGENCDENVCVCAYICRVNY